ncbi:hypothetical protein M8818_003496 [Zalaria obscura]|uniref:Uncharacterized protein n=1 Tax=Zalaria obscura TaxID=2024903 RepID=A0ACC3SFD6_9PEZI
MRLTRAQAAAQQIHLDEPEAQDSFAKSTTSKDEREPLGEITVNSIDGEKEARDDTQNAPAVVDENQGRGRGRKAKKAKEEGEAQGEVPEMTEHEIEQDMMLDGAIDEQHNVGAAASVEAEPVGVLPDRTRDADDQTPTQESQVSAAEEGNTAPSEVNSGTIEDTVVHHDITEPQTVIEESEPATPAVETEESILLPKRTPATDLQRKEAVGMRSTSNKENMAPFSPVSMQSPNIPEASVQPTPLPAGDPALEPIPQELANPSPAPLPDHQEVVEAESSSQELAPSGNALPPAANATSPPKPQRANSVIHKPTSRPSTLNRTSSVRQSTKTTSTLGRTSFVRQSTRPSRRPSSNDTDKSNEKREVSIPHSKPRPVGMKFPTPPPPAKSSKPPTKSTFMLPGEAVAAKLKAAKEAREKKDAEEDERKVFKARPAPKFAPVDGQVRQTKGSQLRQSLMVGKEEGATVGLGGLKRANSVRESIMGRASGVTAERKRMSVASKPLPGPTIAPLPKPETKTASTTPPAPKPAVGGDLKVKKRPSEATTTKQPERARLSSLNSNRPSTTATKPASTQGRLSSINTLTTASARIPSSGRTASGSNKGKEVFNRAALEKQAEEKAKREKEEAAKKARAEAAERSRQLSRQWAEERKKKVLLKAKLGKEGKVEGIPAEEGAKEAMGGDDAVKEGEVIAA